MRLPFRLYRDKGTIASLPQWAQDDLEDNRRANGDLKREVARLNRHLAEIQRTLDLASLKAAREAREPLIGGGWDRDQPGRVSIQPSSMLSGASTLYPTMMGYPTGSSAQRGPHRSSESYTTAVNPVVMGAVAGGAAGSAASCDGGGGGGCGGGGVC